MYAAYYGHTDTVTALLEAGAALEAQDNFGVGALMIAAIPKGAQAVALDGRGKLYSSEQLGEQLARWRMDGRDLAFLVGGPEGLAPAALERANQRWSLGPATLPHPLVRIVVAEQLYRAASLLGNHPYHRG